MDHLVNDNYKVPKLLNNPRGVYRKKILPFGPLNLYL